jgi:hypothetical protein
MRFEGDSLRRFSILLSIGIREYSSIRTGCFAYMPVKDNFEEKSISAGRSLVLWAQEPE